MWVVADPPRGGARGRTLAHGPPGPQAGAYGVSIRGLILVDGFNVLHAGVLRGRDRAGWWRPEAQERLLDALGPLARGPDEVRVVFDARRGAPGAATRPGLEVLHAPSADDRIAEEALREAPRRAVLVATSDRELAERARAAGARVAGAGAFLRGLGAGAPGAV